MYHHICIVTATFESWLVSSLVCHRFYLKQKKKKSILKGLEGKVTKNIASLTQEITKLY